jgi:hypothetical protein
MERREMHTNLWLENIDMAPERRNSGAREMDVTRLRHGKHHVSEATVTRVTMEIQLGIVISVLSVKFEPTVVSPNCRVTAVLCIPPQGYIRIASCGLFFRPTLAPNRHIALITAI